MSRCGLSGADIRERNIAAILRILRAEGPRSRSGLAQRLGLSRSGMTPIVAEMAERGLVREQAGAPLGRGRPPLLLSLTADELCIIGVELRRDRVGCHVEALDGSIVGAVDLSQESIPEEPRRAAQLVASLARRSEQDSGRTAVAVGICLPGTTHSGGRVDAPVLGWRDVPFVAMIEEALGDVPPTLLVTDIAAAATLGHDHPGSEDRLRAHIQFGPGLGLGICEIHPGSSPRPESRGIGHIAWPGATAPCWCGASGCLDTVLGLHVVTEELCRLTGMAGPGAAVQLSAALAEARRTAPAELGAWIDELADRIAWVVRMVAQFEQPDVITLGGYVATLDDDFETALHERLTSEGGIPDGVAVLPSRNDDAAMRGVATAATNLVLDSPLTAIGPAR